MSWKQFTKWLLENLAAPSPAQPPPKPRATLAFVVQDTSGIPVKDAIATFTDGTEKQANDDGYIAVERDLGTHTVNISADGFVSQTRRVVLESNRQFTVTLASAKPAPPQPPVPVPTPVPTPIHEPPKAPVTDEEFRVAFFEILKKRKAPRTVNLQTLNDTKADVEAIGCEWQHDSAGTLRPRLFLPVAPGADPYSRPYDVGLYGEPWTWIKR